MNTNTLQPEYAEIAEVFLLAWDNGNYDSIPTETFILKLVEKCQSAALKRDAEISELKSEVLRIHNAKVDHFETVIAQQSEIAVLKDSVFVAEEANEILRAGVKDLQELTGAIEPRFKFIRLEITDLQAEIAALKKAHADLFATSQEMNFELVALRKEVEAAKKWTTDEPTEAMYRAFRGDIPEQQDIQIQQKNRERFAVQFKSMIAAMQSGK